MTRTTIEAIGSRMMSMALDNLERDGYVAFAALVIAHNGEVAPIMLEHVDAEQKEKLAALLRQLAPHSQAIVIISEAWTLTKDLVLPLEKPVSEHNERQEGVFVQVASREGDLLLTTLFSRDESNRPVRPTDITMAWNTEVFNARGTFQNIFAGVSA